MNKFIYLFLILNINLIYSESTNEPTNIEKSNDLIISKSELSDTQKTKVIHIAHLNDSHENLSVKWLGKGSSVMIVLGKNNKPKNNDASKTTNVYISFDYGSTFIKEERLIIPGDNKTTNSTPAIINTFITSKANNSHFIFTDIVNNYLFISRDYGKNYETVQTCSPRNQQQTGHLCWSPKNLQMNPELVDYILASSDEDTSDLHLSTNFGKNWTNIQHNVTKFSWANFQKADRFYSLILQPDGKKHLYYTDNYFQDSVFLRNDVKDFKICNKYIVVIRYTHNLGSSNNKNKNLRIDVSFNSSSFSYALFNNDYNNMNNHSLIKDTIDYTVVDCSDNELLLAAKYENGKINLFVSNYKGNRFRLSLENVVPSNSNKTTVDVTKVAGLSGIYIANVYENNNNQTIISKITYDSGYSWSKINIDQFQSELKQCKNANCSLHFLQNSLIYSHKYPGITSKESAVGIIVASGIIDENISNDSKVNTKSVPQTFLSRDAGLSWRKISDGKYLFNIGDMGGIIVGVKQFSKSSSTKSLIYSLDDGLTFKELEFIDKPMRVYSLLSETEKTSIFTIFGSMDSSTHSWTLVKVNLTSFYNRTCDLSTDFEYWSPHLKTNASCLMGVKLKLLRRKENVSCYHGEDFNRKTKPYFCECTRDDYVCDFNFHETVDRSCIPDEDILNTEQDCSIGKLSKGFQRIPGNQCLPPHNSEFEPLELNCSATKPVKSRELFKTIFISLILTCIVFASGYYGIAYFKNRQTNRNLLNTHYSARHDSAILLDADDLNNDETHVRGFQDEIPVFLG